ncbi:MAG: glycerol-3-phosphate acyltransferase [Firmicutes bacterium]|nr:glycerol-3-phosphate acyltransferase [Bacillota bacterium]MCL2771625.1 glycerol-3-phosphate acyltransferase [Bacillota bacterium]
MFWFWFSIIIVSIFSYFLGNLNFAKLISKFVLKDDITKKGSGNPGTMNMYRNFGLKFGLLTLGLDALKGSLPAMIGLFVFGPIYGFGTEALFIFGTIAVIGHCFPLIYKFKGGKGIATSFGVFVVANPIVAGICFILAVLGLLAFEYGAIVSLIFMAGLVCYAALENVGNVQVLVCLCVIFILTWAMHYPNIIKMLIGTENRLRLRSAFAKKLRKD